jgi:hypothetical protein
MRRRGPLPRQAQCLIAQHFAQMMLVQVLRLHLAEGANDRLGWLFALAEKQMSAAISAMYDDPAHSWTLQCRLSPPFLVASQAGGNGPCFRQNCSFGHPCIRDSSLRIQCWFSKTTAALADSGSVPWLRSVYAIELASERVLIGRAATKPSVIVETVTSGYSYRLFRSITGSTTVAREYATACRCRGTLNRSVMQM